MHGILAAVRHGQVTQSPSSIAEPAVMAHPLQQLCDVCKETSVSGAADGPSPEGLQHAKSLIVVRAPDSSVILKQKKYQSHDLKKENEETNAHLGDLLNASNSVCESLHNARTVFELTSKQIMVTHNALIENYAQGGHDLEAIKLFQQICKEGIEPDLGLCICVLKACAAIGDWTLGNEIHGCIIDCGFESNVFVGSAVVDMYAKCGNLEDAHMVFMRSRKRSLVTWNTLLTGYAQHGHGEEALKLFKNLQQESIKPNKITFVCALKACAGLGALEDGKQIHAHMVECGFELDLWVGSALVHMYADYRYLDEAQSLFERLPMRNVVTWSALIAGYAQYGHGQKAFLLFREMQRVGVQPNQVTFSCILRACCNTEALEQGRRIHASIIGIGLEFELFILNNVVDMYGKCGSIQDAHILFYRMPNRNVITWSALIAGYAQHGHGWEALQLYLEMQNEGIVPNQVTFLCVVKACSSIPALEHGQAVHAHIVASGLNWDLLIGNALINMYVKCGALMDACIVFDWLPQRDVISWSGLIAGYIEQGLGPEALRLFGQMQEGDVKPDQVTCAYMLEACSSMGALGQGKQIHAYLVENGLDSCEFVGSAVIDMYAKCGSLEDANVMFEKLPTRDVVTWSTLIAGHAYNCESICVFYQFQRMQQAGLRPDCVTFLCLLSACSHVGAIDEGRHYFKSIREVYGLLPTLPNFNSMVDLLGHGGFMNEAEDLLESVPFGANVAGWTSLLSSCKAHSNVNVGRRCFNQVVRMERGNAAGYALMSSIYTHVGMQEDAYRVEQARAYANAWKKPGKAFIEIQNQIHGFNVADKTHARSDDIYSKLNTLSIQMKEEGYVPHLNLVVNVTSDEDKEGALCGHCEKLAISFGLLSTLEGTTIRVAKNLRVCSDCHTATKIISKIEKREIVVADTYCIHHFKDGECSCNDYY